MVNHKVITNLMRSQMPTPNETQAVNLLRRLRADSTRQEAEKSAKALIGRIQAQGATLTVQGVLHTALAANPDQDVLAAVQAMAEQIAHAEACNAQVQRLFDAAAAAEEIRLAPIDAGCTKRLEEIQELLDEAQRDYKAKLLNQDFAERRLKTYTDKGLVRHEIEALGIPFPEPRSDQAKIEERNQWGFELQEVTQRLTGERDTIIRFKRTRNENGLPAAVLALVEGSKP